MAFPDRIERTVEIAHPPARGVGGARQAVAKHLARLAEAGLVRAEPGERRRVRYRLRPAPMQVAQGADHGGDDER